MTTKDNKRRNGFILVAAAVALLLVVAGIGIYLLTSDSPADEPTSAAQEFVTVFERGLNTSGRDVDVTDFEPVVCAENMPQLREAFSAKENPVEGAPRFQLSVKDVKTDGDKGGFTVVTEISVPGTDKQTTDENFGLVRQDGAWRVCGLGL